MPIRFLAKPLGVAIICGNDGPGLLVLARPCDLRPLPPKLGPTMILQLEEMESADIYHCRIDQRAALERIYYLRGFGLVVRRGIGKWALTADGRAWLALHRHSDLGRKRHQQRHHEAVLGAVRSGISKFQNIAVHLQLTRSEVRAALKALYKANLVEKIGVIGWRCPNAVQQPSKKKRAQVEHGDAESV